MKQMANMKIFVPLAAAFVMLVSGWMAAGGGLWPASSPPRQGEALPARIVKVVDGDTVKASMDGKEETIRLLLVDTPETVHPDKPVEPFGPEASDYAKRMLAGQTVGLETDVSKRDKYGRLLCYLWVGDRMFNELLLENGLARLAYVEPPNTKYAQRLRRAEQTAKSAKRGIWSLPGYVHDNGFYVVPSVASKHPATPGGMADGKRLAIESIRPSEAGRQASLLFRNPDKATAVVRLYGLHGPMKLNGLIKGKAAPDGELWQWQIPGRLPKGSWPVTVSTPNSAVGAYLIID